MHKADIGGHLARPHQTPLTASSSSIDWSCLPLRAVLYVLLARKSPLQESPRSGSPAADLSCDDSPPWVLQIPDQEVQRLSQFLFLPRDRLCSALGISR